AAPDFHPTTAANPSASATQTALQRRASRTGTSRARRWRTPRSSARSARTSAANPAHRSGVPTVVMRPPGPRSQTKVLFLGRPGCTRIEHLLCEGRHRDGGEGDDGQEEAVPVVARVPELVRGEDRHLDGAEAGDEERLGPGP